MYNLNQQDAGDAASMKGNRKSVISGNFREIHLWFSPQCQLLLPSVSQLSPPLYSHIFLI